ncbi:MAG: B12-binding domain-containing radical SAM protein [bacterium]|nr:B12-binding domain-containing radical SAM protein [bacterium]
MKKKRAILINPPIHDVITNLFVQHPYGLLKISAYLKSTGYDVSWIDCMEECYYPEYSDNPFFLNSTPPVRDTRLCGYSRSGTGKKRYHLGLPYSHIPEQLKQIGRPDEIYVGSSLTYYYEGVHEAIHFCKKTYPDVPVLMGGIYPTICPGHAGTSEADTVVAGELEPATNLTPDTSLLKKDKADYVVIKTTRGCPRRCSYCAVPFIDGRTIRHRDIPDVMKEIELRIRTGYKRLIFWESNILSDAPDYLELLLDEMIRKKLHIPIEFPEGLDGRLLYPRLVEKLKAAGLKWVFLSLESRDRELQKRFHKNLSLPAFKNSVEMFRRYGYCSAKRHNYYTDRGISVFILIGLPGQSLESILLTILDVWRSGCRPLLMAFTPIPGTEEYNNLPPRLKNKKLEDLLPRLWPCSTRNLPAEDLDELMHFNYIYCSFEQIRDLQPRTRIDKMLKTLP